MFRSIVISAVVCGGISIAICEALTLFGFPKKQPPGLSKEVRVGLARKRYHDNQNSDYNDDDYLTNTSVKMMPMKDKVAIVTGAAGGIGSELVRTLHSLGATIVALDRNETGLNELKASIMSEYPYKNNTGDDDRRIQLMRICQEDLSSVAQVADEIKSKFHNIDVLVNNAGLSYGADRTVLGAPNTKATNGKDLLFVVNYLSHFLLTEKLLSNLSRSGKGRIVHVTSTFHWRVDGSELLIPSSPYSTSTSKKCPLAYESDPAKQGPDHIGNSYPNSKLAQIWHSYAIAGKCSSVCACPTWASTGIAGDEGRDLLSEFAFPVHNCGPGMTSIINAILRTDEELGNAIGGTRNHQTVNSFVANCNLIDQLRYTGIIWLMSRISFWSWLRTTITDLLAAALLLGQRFTHEEFIIQKTSPESCDKQKQSQFYDWSLKEVSPWL